MAATQPSTERISADAKDQLARLARDLGRERLMVVTKVSRIQLTKWITGFDEVDDVTAHRVQQLHELMLAMRRYEDLPTVIRWLEEGREIKRPTRLQAIGEDDGESVLNEAYIFLFGKG